MYPQVFERKLCGSAWPICGSALGTRDNSIKPAEDTPEVDLIAGLMAVLDESKRKQQQESQKNRPHVDATHESNTAEMAPNNGDGAEEDEYDTLDKQLKAVMENKSETLEQDRGCTQENPHSTSLNSNILDKPQSLDEEVEQKDEHGRFSKGSNHKRTFTEVHSDDLKKLQLLPQLQQPEDGTIPELSRHDQVRVEDFLEGEYKQSIHQTPQAQYALPQAGHEVSTMPGSSTTKKRKLRSTSAEPAATDDPADAATSSSTIKGDRIEIPDSQEEYEKEGDVVNSKRVKPNTRERLQQHISETDAAISAKNEPEYAHDNARKSEASLEIKAAPKRKREPWAAKERYNSAASSLPDYGDDIVSIAAKPATRNNMGRIPPGFKPYNGLSANGGTSRPHPPVQSQQLTNPASKSFDLHNGYYSSKRQRIEGGSLARTETHRAVIELDNGPVTNGHNLSAKSGDSYTQNEYSRYNASVSELGVQEYRNVEDSMKSNRQRRRVGGSSNAQTSKSGEVQPQARPNGIKRTVIKHGELADAEDKDDPISGSDFEIVPPGVPHGSSVQVVIESPPGYKGTAFHKQPGENVGGRRGNMSNVARNQRGRTSGYFPPMENGKRRQDSSGSSVVELEQTKAGPTARHQNDPSTERSNASTSSKRRRDSDGSMDELGAGHESQHQETANQLLANRRRTNGSSASAITEEDIDFSEDELRTEGKFNKADIIPTNFHRKGKPPQVKGEDRFTLVQIFSERCKWLVDGSEKPWTLIRNQESNILTVLDHEHSLVQDLNIVPTKILACKGDAKIVLYKSKEQTAQGSTKFCLELGDAAQGDDFRAILGKAIPTINTSAKSCEFLQGTFNTTLKEAKPAVKRARRSGEEEPRDIQNMEMNSKARLTATFDKAQAAKKILPELKLINRMEDNDGNSNHVIQATAGTRKTRSSDIFDVESQAASRPSGATKLPPSNFYGNGNGLEVGSSPTTRSSTRNLNSGVTPRQRPRTRTPSPERWTESNPSWKKKWRNSIIYPREGKNKATVDKQDIERLDEGQFLNDNLIMFYLLRLERALAQDRPDLAKRVYFHNTFFYERLSKPVKGKRGINYEAVERWTSKVDLLSYDYIIVPVNEHSHWYVAIICNAPRLLQPEPESVEDLQPQDTRSEARKVPSDTDPANKKSPLSSPKPLASVSATEVGESLKHLSVKDMPVAGGDKGPPVDDARPNAVSREASRNEASTTAGPIPHSPVEPGASKPISPSRKGKRKSTSSAPRKYDPKEPRIITLDSLSMSHSATCTNLRDYLIAEAKSKRNIDNLHVSGPLGMTSTKIPTQKNYCDCGLYLLSYVEEFLTNPDQFTNDILQRVDMEVSYDFKKAPEMRNHIRDLLFQLQEEQQIEEDARPPTAKGKKTSKTPVKDKLPTPVETGSRETSKSARPSVEPVRAISKGSSAQGNTSEKETSHKRLEPTPKPEQAALQPSFEYPAKAGKRELNTTRPSFEKKIATEPAVPAKVPFNEPIDLEDEVQHAPGVQTNPMDKPKHILSSVATSIFSTFSRLGKSPEVAAGTTGPGSSRANPAEIIGDSPQKVKSCAHPTRDLDTPTVQLLFESNVRSNLRSPSPIESNHYKDVRERQSTPHPTSPKRSSTSTDLGEAPERKRNSPPPARLDSPDPSSPLLEPAGKPPSPKSTSDAIDLTLEDSQIADDREMLLQQDPVSSTTLLDDLSSPATPAISPKRRTAATSPKRASNRKPTSARRRPSFSMEGRDASDRAIIGRHGSYEYSGKRMKFSPGATSVQSRLT